MINTQEKTDTALDFVSSRCLGRTQKDKKEEVIVKTQNKAQKDNKDQVSQKYTLFPLSSLLFFFPSFIFFLSLSSLLHPSALLYIFPSFLCSSILYVYTTTTANLKMSQIKIPQSWNYHYLESDISVMGKGCLVGCLAVLLASTNNMVKIFTSFQLPRVITNCLFPGGQNFTWLKNCARIKCI